VLSISSIKTWMKLWHTFSLHNYLFLCFLCRLGFVIGTLLLPLHQNNMLLMSSMKAPMKLSHLVLCISCSFSCEHWILSFELNCHIFLVLPYYSYIFVCRWQTLQKLMILQVFWCFRHNATRDFLQS
jgi:hypothetical protein